MIPLRIWPVIHLESVEQALANARVALAEGASGVFLIHMDGDDDMIEPAAIAIRAACPGLAIGANYLSLPASAALIRALTAGLEASWSDNPGVRSDRITDEAQAIAGVLADHPNHLFFGSVAFKYQPSDPNPGEAAVRAQSLGMLPTTSGTATGRAPSGAKLTGIREALGPEGRLAVASGVDRTNIGEIAPLVSDILVSTGICQDFYTFDPARLAALIAAGNATR